MGTPVYGHCDNYGKHEVYTKDDFAIITGEMYLEANADTGEVKGEQTVDFPEGFNIDNCVVLSFGVRNSTRSGGGYSFGTDTMTNSSKAITRASMGKNVFFNTAANCMKLIIQADEVYTISETVTDTCNYKIVLMKIS